MPTSLDSESLPAHNFYPGDDLTWHEVDTLRNEKGLLFADLSSQFFKIQQIGCR